METPSIKGETSKNNLFYNQGRAKCWMETSSIIRDIIGHTAIYFSLWTLLVGLIIQV